ncbi:unnamed protein product [Caenorhabditis auriculariae]|uniref:Uncharacterized protein n=1 Tax=Caenorhabditis auriculariae TaxID=2777116 RepID=A0A8S1H4Y4_9PELO|nr:unnamed protein product [Caenorhabditis auriculariae]
MAGKFTMRPTREDLRAKNVLAHFRVVGEKRWPFPWERALALKIAEMTNSEKVNGEDIWQDREIRFDVDHKFVSNSTQIKTMIFFDYSD